MTSGFADSRTPQRITLVRESRAAVVAVDEAGRECARSLLAGAAWSLPWAVAAREVEHLASYGPDAVVLVADFGNPAGLAALRRVRSEVPAARIVVVACADSHATTARQALNAGAEAFVPAHEAGHALEPALNAVMAGFVCTPRGARRLVAKPTFSHREKEVLALLVSGLTNRQIGERLFLAESTVKSHLASTFAKLGVRSRKDAVALLLDPAEDLATTALPPAGAG